VLLAGRSVRSLEAPMSGAAPSDKRKKRAHNAFTLGDKVWLLDYADRNPNLNAADLGIALAAHLNSPRTADQVARDPPGRATVNDWRKIKDALRTAQHIEKQRITG
jgi:hypothetical protein